ncbi:molybdenum cofactor guanylyltransferase [Aestuariibacter halophilus]|uniref:Molybdenum cofactor guanylyltransferase n=1 Tax=Fluctibacter halophilus TaxID=226011 RepID=A0ABS8G377_9ALTE|nr:molybdenum cofactor guanylyltransferase [Aestuariibacter halophilus]MCC2615057.1 molybdenum cofactor guanylyltransferase [Aestuariibacter halophilus]
MKTIGVVLAGGQSTRMGQDKSLLHINGNTMLQRSQWLLQRCGVESVVISRNSPGRAFIRDHYAEKGPLGGIHAVAHAYPKHNLLCIPVDMPLLTVTNLKALYTEGCRQYRSAYFHQHSLPLFLMNTVRTRLYLEQTLFRNADLSIRAMLKALPSIGIAVRDRQELLNSNDQHQWQHALSLVASQ